MTPRQAIGVLQLKKILPPGLYTEAPCPCCSEGSLRVVEDGFYCGPGCRFNRGTPEDLLSFLLGGPANAEKIASAAGCPYDMEDTCTSRPLLDFAIKMEKRGASNPDMEQMSMIMAARRLSINDGHISKAIWFLNGNETEELACALPGTLGSDLSRGALVVIPFWADRYRIESIVFFGRDIKKPKVIEINPYGFSWYGLAQLHPDCSEFSVWPFYTNASRHAAFLSRFNPRILATALKVNPECEKRGFIPSVLKFHCPHEWWLSELPAWSRLEKLVPATYITCDPDSGESREKFSFSELLTRLAIENFKGGELKTRNFIDTLRLCQLDHEDARLVLELCLRHGKNKWIEVIRKELSKKLVWRSKGINLYQTLDGYEVEKNGVFSRITNFTYELDTMVYFLEALTPIVTGRVESSGFSMPFSMPAGKIGAANLLEKDLQPIQLCSSGGIEKAPLLSILDKADYKTCLPYFLEKVSSAKRVQGFQRLGWNSKHDIFYTPMAAVTADFTSVGVEFHPEENSGLHVFGGCQITLDEIQAGLQATPVPVLGSMISTIVAWMCRSYHGMRKSLMAIKNTPENREILIRLFKGAGQKDWFRPASILPRAFENLGDYPCCFGNINSLQAGKLNLGGFYLDDTGDDLPSFSDADLETAAVSLRSWLHHTVKNLLEGKLKSFSEVRSVRKKNSYAHEGYQTIAALGHPNWPVPGREFPKIDVALEVKEPIISTCFLLDSKSGFMKALPALWDGSEKPDIDLVIELGLLCAKCEPAKDHVVLDALSGCELLESFYGKIPAIKQAKI